MSCDGDYVGIGLQHGDLTVSNVYLHDMLKQEFFVEVDEAGDGDLCG